MKRASVPVSGLLRSCGLRVTTQRLRVLETLVAASEPLTIDELAQQVPAINIVTLYRMLDRFVREGLVYRTDFQDGKASFEYQSHHHHHVTCRSCGYREEVPVCKVPEMPQTSNHFERIENHVLEFFGICRSCAPQK